MVHVGYSHFPVEYFWPMLCKTFPTNDVKKSLINVNQNRLFVPTKLLSINNQTIGRRFTVWIVGGSVFSEKDKDKNRKTQAPFLSYRNLYFPGFAFLKE